MLIVDRVASTSTSVHNGLHFDVSDHFSRGEEFVFFFVKQKGSRDDSLQVDMKNTNQYMTFFCQFICFSRVLYCVCSSESRAVPVPKTGVCCKCSICRALMEVVVFLSFLSSACVTLTLSALAPLPPALEVRGQMDQAVGLTHLQ